MSYSIANNKINNKINGLHSFISSWIHTQHFGHEYNISESPMLFIRSSSAKQGEKHIAFGFYPEI